MELSARFLHISGYFRHSSARSLSLCDAETECAVNVPKLAEMSWNFQKSAESPLSNFSEIFGTFRLVSAHLQLLKFIQHHIVRLATCPKRSLSQISGEFYWELLSCWSLVRLGFSVLTIFPHGGRFLSVVLRVTVLYAILNSPTARNPPPNTQKPSDGP